jgi:hypothetical protein
MIQIYTVRSFPFIVSQFNCVSPIGKIRYSFEAEVRFVTKTKKINKYSSFIIWLGNLGSVEKLLKTSSKY